MSSFRSSVRAHPARRLLAITVAAALAVATVIGFGGAASAQQAAQAPVAAPDFGPNVTIFDPSMPTSQIQAAVDAISAQQVDNEMGTERYSLLFKPGTYGTAAAAAESRWATTPRWPVWVATRPTSRSTAASTSTTVPAVPPPPGHHCVALNNFWRSLSNLTINVTHAATMTDCRKTGKFWAASQASPMRRVNINGNLTLDGLLHQRAAVGQRRLHRRLQDRQRRQRVAAAVPGPRQQASAPGRTASGTRCSPACRARRPTNFGDTITDPGNGQPMLGTYTNLPTNPVSREKPYLYVDSAGTYNVFVPERRDQFLGHHLAERPDARPVDSVVRASTWPSRPTRSPTINAQLAGRQEPAADSGRLRRRPDASRSTAPTRSFSGWACRH